MRLTVCPTCKQAVAVDLPVVDLNTNEVSYGGVTQKMSGTQVEVLAAIMVRFPRTATYHEIAKDVWGNQQAGIAGPQSAYTRLRYSPNDQGVSVHDQNAVGRGLSLRMARRMGAVNRFARFIPALISLHTAAGTIVEVNSELITHMHNPYPGNKAFVDKVNCMVNLADGRFVTVIETCDQVRRAIEAARK